jgi:hypothetical protein
MGKQWRSKACISAQGTLPMHERKLMTTESFEG